MSESREPSDSPSATRTVFWLGAVAAAILVLVFLDVPTGSLLASALLNAGHAPLFGCIAFALLQASLGLARVRLPSRGSHYLAAFAAAGALGVLTEVGQYFLSRDAEVQDVVRDVLGAAAFLLVAWAVDRRAHPSHGGRLPRRAIAIVSAVLLMAAALADAATVTLAYLRRDAAFPTICEFGASWARVFVGVRDGELAVTPPLAGWDARGNGRVGRVTLLPGEYPSFIIQEPHPDWAGYARLVFDVYSEAKAPVDLVIRIDDAKHDNSLTDRFNRVLSIQPGANRFSIPLAEVRDAPRGRTMDMSHIRNVMLFAVAPKAPLTVYFDEFRLERE